MLHDTHTDPNYCGTWASTHNTFQIAWMELFERFVYSGVVSSNMFRITIHRIIS